MAAMGQLVGGPAADRQTACISQMGRFETETPTARMNRKALVNPPGIWIDRLRRRRSPDKLIRDLDS